MEEFIYNKYGWSKEGINKRTGTKYNYAGYDKDGYNRAEVDNLGWEKEDIDNSTKIETHDIDEVIEAIDDRRPEDIENTINEIVEEENNKDKTKKEDEQGLGENE